MLMKQTDMSYGRTLVAICAIITLGSTSCAVDSVPGIEGTIFRFNLGTTLCYTPNTGRIVDLALRENRQSPHPLIECRGPNDTIICEVRLNGIDHEISIDGLLFSNPTLGKYVPFENRVDPIVEFADTSFWAGQIDYDSQNGRYLLSGRLGGSQDAGVFILDESLKIVHDLTDLFRRLVDKLPGFDQEAHFLSNGNLIIGKIGGPADDAIYELDTTLQTCNLIARGRLQAVSTNKDLAIITTYGSISLYDVKTKTLSQLPLETRGKVRHIRAYCFSPDDRYIAYTVRENDFRHTARLHIYDLQERKNYKTVPIGFGPLLWLPIDPPAEIFETHKWW